MNTDELQAMLNKLKDVRDAANWQGKFTAEVRIATRDYRRAKLAHPLDEVITQLEAELRRRGRKRRKRLAAPEYRPPYND